jgi:hypothetical protein
MLSVDWPNALVAIGAAAAAALGTAIVAIKALGSQREISEADRAHARELAEADRAHDLQVRRAERRADAYIELMKALHRSQMGVDRTEPIMSMEGDPGPPPNLSDEKAWTLQALSDVVASDEVRSLIEEWFKKAREFYAQVGQMRYAREQLERGFLKTVEEFKAQYGVESHVRLWQKADELRKELREDVQAIGARIRSEL